MEGPNKEKENSPEYILEAITHGYDVEVDVWVDENGSILLGHDRPQYNVESEFIKHEKIWCHAKNSEALFFLKEMGSQSIFSMISTLIQSCQTAIFGHTLVQE